MECRRFSQTLGLGLSAWMSLQGAVAPGQDPRSPQPGVVQLGGQTQAPQGGTGQTIPGQNTASPAGQLPRPQVVLQEDPQIEQILRAWEQYTRSIERLHGPFDRFVYDATFLVEKRAVGEFWYEAPDKGRIDLHPFPEERMPPANEKGQRLNPKKLGPNDHPYTVLQDRRSKWICRGDALLAIDVDEKTYHMTEVPPHMRGKNITASPLPFLFGMSSAELRKRFLLSPGALNDPDGARSGVRQIHLVAIPRLEAQASEFKRAEVLLDPGVTLKDSSGQPVFVPFAIKLWDPTGQQETVYVFKVTDTKLNERPLFFGDPFKNPSLWQGYKLLEHRKMTLEEDPNQRSAESPAPAPQSPERRLFR